jgi:uncharacterized membrane protein
MEFGYYQLLLVIHIVTVVVGIGTVSLNGLYGSQAKKAGPNGGNAVVRANFAVTEVAEYFIYAIPVTGILMILKNEAFEFSDTWVWLSIVLYVAALGIAHAVLRPSSKRMIELTQGPPTPEMEAVGKKLAMAGTANELIAVALIVLMVWKPGTF